MYLYNVHSTKCHSGKDNFNYRSLFVIDPLFNIIQYNNKAFKNTVTCQMDVAFKKYCTFSSYIGEILLRHTD